MESNGKIIFDLVVLIIICIASLWQFFVWARRIYLINQMPVSTIRAAAQGYVELSGNARSIPGKNILAHYTKRDCVWYSYTLEEAHTTRKNDLLDQGESSHLFCLEDATGRCIVDPSGANVTACVRRVWYCATLDPDAETTRKPQRYRFTESIIPIDTTIYVLGEFTTQKNAEGMLENSIVATADENRPYLIASVSRTNAINQYKNKRFWYFVTSVLSLLFILEQLYKLHLLDSSIIKSISIMFAR